MPNAMLLYYYFVLFKYFNVIFVESHIILYSPFIFSLLCFFFYCFPAQLLAQAENCCNKLVNQQKMYCFLHISHIFFAQLCTQCKLNVCARNKLDCFLQIICVAYLKPLCS